MSLLRWGAHRGPRKDGRGGPEGKLWAPTKWSLKPPELSWLSTGLSGESKANSDTIQELKRSSSAWPFCEDEISEINVIPHEIHHVRRPPPWLLKFEKSNGYTQTLTDRSRKAAPAFENTKCFWFHDFLNCLTKGLQWVNFILFIYFFCHFSFYGHTCGIWRFSG